MNTYLVSLFSVCLCLGVIMLISSAIPLPINNAQAAIDYSNVNYTNIFINKTYMDIVNQARDYVLTPRDLDFGISISNTCYTMHKHNVSSTCPTYEAIMALFPDTSDQDVSGKFIYKHNQLQRETPPMERSYNYYAFEDKTHLFIDPGYETSKSLGMITIYSSLPDYPIQFQVGDNKTLKIGTGRYIDNCRNAVIDGKNWIFLVGDTIEYMRHDCEESYTLFKDTKVIQSSLSVVGAFDITTSAKWLHDEFLKYVKENCLYEYDKC